MTGDDRELLQEIADRARRTETRVTKVANAPGHRRWRREAEAAWQRVVRANAARHRSRTSSRRSAITELRPGRGVLRRGLSGDVQRVTFRGAEIRHVYVDELHDHTVDALRCAQYEAQGWRSSAPHPPRCKPLEVSCSACGAVAGERCNRGRDPRTGRKRYRGYHFRRKDDARLATEAVRALNPG
jgi:hypothetical protein